MGVTPSQFELLSGLLDAASLRHQVIAHNVANVNTPGFHGREVSFEEALRREYLLNGPTADRRPEPRIVERPGGIAREDGNNVDIDAEMGRLAKNTTLFGVYSQILATRMAAMRSAISGH